MHHNHFTRKEWEEHKGWVRESWDKEEYLYCLTDREWYGSFGDNGRLYVRVDWYKCDSNLDLYSIYMAGTDDYSLSFDVIGKDEFDRLYTSIINSPCITEEIVKDFYFSN